MRGSDSWEPSCSVPGHNIFFVVCDGLKGLPEVQTWIGCLIATAFTLPPSGTGDELRRNVKPIFTTVNAAADRGALGHGGWVTGGSWLLAHLRPGPLHSASKVPARG